METQQDVEGHRAPDPVRNLFRSSEAEVSTSEAAQNGFRGTLNRFGFKLQPGAAERHARERRAALEAARAVILHSAFTRPVGVLIANPKGTSGKTPATLGLASAFAAVKGNGICALEVADDSGTLALRAEGVPQLDLGDLVRDITSIRSSGQLAGYAVQQSSFVDVFGSRPGESRPALTADDVVNVSRVIDEYYRFRFMDSGNVVTTGPFLGAIDVADVLVVPVMMARDSGLKAIEMLDGLIAAGGHAAELARNAVILRMTDGRPENSVDRDDVVRYLEERGGARQFDIPFDAHIAERRDITWAKVSAATQEAFTFAAAEIVRVVRGEAPSTAVSRPSEAAPASTDDEDPDGAESAPNADEAPTPAPVSVSAAAAPRASVVPAVASDPREDWVTCSECGKQTPPYTYCSFCKHQLTDNVNLQRFYNRGRRASGYAEPAEDLPEQLRALPPVPTDNDDTATDTDNDNDESGSGRASA